MRCILGVLVMLVAVPVLAEDGRITRSTLDEIGLGGIQAVSDEEGSQIRGASSFAHASGQGVVSGLLVDPWTSSFVFVSDVNTGFATSHNAGLSITSSAMARHGAAGVANLTIASSRTTSFTGSLRAYTGFAVTPLAGWAYAFAH